MNEGQAPITPANQQASKPSNLRARVALMTLLLALASGNVTGLWFHHDQSLRLTARQGEIEKQRAIAASLNDRLVSASTTRGALQRRRSALEANTAELTRRIGEASARSAASELRAEQAEAQAGELDAKLADQRRKLDEGQREIEALRLSLEAERSRAQRAESERQQATALLKALRKQGLNPERRAGFSQPAKLSGTVLQVDQRTTPPTLVLDLGQQDGLELDDLLYISRRGRVIARARVTRLDAATAAARIQSARSDTPTGAGDRVSTIPPSPLAPKAP